MKYKNGSIEVIKIHEDVNRRKEERLKMEVMKSSKISKMMENLKGMESLKIKMKMISK